MSIWVYSINVISKQGCGTISRALKFTYYSQQLLTIIFTYLKCLLVRIYFMEVLLYRNKKRTKKKRNMKISFKLQNIGSVFFLFYLGFNYKNFPTFSLKTFSVFFLICRVLSSVVLSSIKRIFKRSFCQMQKI